MILRLVTSLLLVGSIQGYRHYQNEVPNGGSVPHPCKPNYVWWGLGHKNPLGGGHRNPFGRDFKNFHSWTQELCMMDSDGDGRTNGEELGDPACRWTKGVLPEITTGITHPGVCDPWGSPECAESNMNVSCETGEFHCDGLNDTDVFNMTLRFPVTKVPARETSYMCFTFDLDFLDPNTDYHLIAAEPYIDNANIMHHTIVTGCNPYSEALTEPKLCNMAFQGCQEYLVIWTLGMPGVCFNQEAGFPVGPKAGVPRINMQHHWTNPELKTDYLDSSGMTFYFTANRRPNNAAYFITGENLLAIPPGRERVEISSTCTQACTRHIMSGPINLMTGFNHMHYLGIEMNVEHRREGKSLPHLTPDETYNYDNPVNHQYNPTRVMKPGDELKTTCVFRSTSRKTTSMFGEGTFDEMCFGLFTYYPAENLKMGACVTWGDLDTCHYNFTDNTLHGCDFNMMFNPFNPMRIEIVSKVLTNCNYYGACRPECPAAIAEIRNQYHCFSDRMSAYITDMLRAYATDDLEIVKFLSAYESCDCPSTPTDPVFPSSASSSSQRVLLLLTATVFRVFI